MDRVDTIEQVRCEIDAGNLDEAETLCLKDLVEQGQTADVLYLLAQISSLQGKTRDAVSCMESVVRDQPRNGIYRAHLAEALRLAGDLQRAIEVARCAVEIAPEEPDAHNCLGLALFAAEKTDEAIDAFTEATRLSPETSGYWNNLGTALRKVRSFTEAIDALKTASRLEPENADVLSNLVNVLLDDGRHSEAVEIFNDLLQIECMSEHLCALGQVYDELGQSDEAEECFRAAQVIDPAAVSSAVNLAFYHKTGATDQDLASLWNQLDDPGLTESQKATLRFALAHLYDDRGKYEEAANQLRHANAVQKQWNDSQDRGYQPGLHQESINRIIETFSSTFFESRISWGSESAKPVFVVGLPRSGTTLTRQILAAHPLVHAVGELKLASDSFKNLPVRLQSSLAPAECVHLITETDVSEIAEDYLAELRRRNVDAHRLVDKMTDNYILIGWLALLFPNSRFIRCVRDPRDIAVSCLITAFANVTWKNDDDHLVDRFEQYRRLVNHWNDVLPGRILDVVYEETVAAPEQQARRLIDWIGLPWDDACLDHTQAGGVIITASLFQARQPMYQSSVERWKNYQPYLGELFDRIRRIETVYN
ncbi:sulfotransferase [Thalassoglobus sp. JC818]|uniref:tetratricopeptide repeat-containing sulfotransferase family protein n=1 Tax=Thalassoglobus sp. JC818 TaxID=3232136 RepID=UPI0034586D56